MTNDLQAIWFAKQNGHETNQCQPIYLKSSRCQICFFTGHFHKFPHRCTLQSWCLFWIVTVVECENSSTKHLSWRTAASSTVSTPSPFRSKHLKACHCVGRFWVTHKSLISGLHENVWMLWPCWFSTGSCHSCRFRKPVSCLSFDYMKINHHQAVPEFRYAPERLFRRAFPNSISPIHTEPHNFHRERCLLDGLLGFAVPDRSQWLKGSNFGHFWPFWKKIANNQEMEKNIQIFSLEWLLEAPENNWVAVFGEKTSPTRPSGKLSCFSGNSGAICL